MIRIILIVLLNVNRIEIIADGTTTQDLIMSNDNKGLILGGPGGGSGLDSLQGKEQDKGSRLEMLDEASLTRQPEEVYFFIICIPKYNFVMVLPHFSIH